ncbi:elongation factor P maturation arginine rhamnosyltransferase EarP [Ramlibacter sp. XY19]|uniref:elongation factor P maturation arginine rhamnosyltransferase EarP n=1 Tax=Ramlibacter paludis TaxID=2908000 RepID=UPI0023DAA37C|nr:elongation factor P maturation arginine rhamnosyltransferase EarP [Ramlibacter paludis]MCG2592623.1 elongation factor P maturation arginine rhamnosyltransferase EarP [Ramlibacter paludis]
MRWDIFCKVIDNHGDAGVCWRLAAELAARGDLPRLWIDDPAPLQWMAPGHPGVEVVHWTAEPPPLVPGDVVVEAFGCDPPDAFVERMARATRPPAWINLEYLSAEAFVERNHGLASPVSQGPGAGLTKFFFYPGFSERTGGLIREQDLGARRAAFDRSEWLRQWGVTPGASQVVSLFCYEPPHLADLLRHLAAGTSPCDLLVTTGRASAATEAALAGLAATHAGWNAAGALRLHWLPLLGQREYDLLLWSCDLNFVRGEDSVVRGLLAGVPCVWQIYPQDDAAHHAKLEAWLAWLRPAPALARFHRVWNGLEAGPLPAPDPAGWGPEALAAQARALALPELVTTLRQFVLARGRI